MKKVLSVLAFSFLLAFSANAQNDSQDLSKELERMMQQMEQMMKGFGSWMEDAPFLMDTSIVHEFYFSPDSLMQDDMIRSMEEMMRHWSMQDFSGFDELLKSIEEFMPPMPEGGYMIPPPEDLPEGTTPPAKKKKKKRKVTKI